MMKRTALIWTALLCALLVGCVDDSYHGRVYEETVLDYASPIQVQIKLGPDDSSGKPKAAVKGSGVIDEAADLEDRKFFVYAFNRQIESFAVTNAENGIGCLIDGTLDDPEALTGREATYNASTGYVSWLNSSDVIYYPSNENAGQIYDFFAYYVDDMELAPEDFHRTSESVYIDVEIDGTQDLMSSCARPSDEEISNVPVNEGEEADMVQVYARHCSYSYMSAYRYGLQPNFVFNHHLVRLRFRLVPGGTHTLAKDVTVESIEAYTQSKAHFTVADRKGGEDLRLEFYGDSTYLALSERNGDSMVPKVISTYKTGQTPGEAIEPDGCLLLPPSDLYRLRIMLSEERPEEGVSLPALENFVDVYQGTSPEEITASFEAGNEYMVTLTVYGRMDIRVGTTVEVWKPGGDYTYDNDEEAWKDK